MSKPIETLYMLNIDPVWAYLDMELPFLINHYHFNQYDFTEVAIELIYEAFNEAIYWKTKHYFRPKRFNQSILFTIFEEMKIHLIPLIVSILNHGEIFFGQVKRVDYLATRSTFVLAVTRHA